MKKIAIKPENKGNLHRREHVPMGQKIPPGKLADALRSKSESLREEGQFAKNAKKWGK